MNRSTSIEANSVSPSIKIKLVRDEDVVENDHRFLAAKLCVALVDVAAFHRTRVAGLAAVDVGDALGVDGNGTDDRIVFIIFGQPHRRHHYQPVRIQTAGLMCFCTRNINAFGRAFNDVHEHVRVRLLVRCKAAVAFDIGHRSADHKVEPLHLGDEFFQVLVIDGVVLFVDLECYRIKRVECVHPNASLKTRSGQLAEPTLHFVLQHYVVPVHRYMQETVYGVARDVRSGRRKVRLTQRKVIGLGNGVDARADHRMFDDVFDQFAKQKHAERAASERIDVIFAGYNGRFG